MNNKNDVLDNGPFFHGTKAELKIGDLLKPQFLSNYQDKRECPISRGNWSGGSQPSYGIMGLG